tara:strand:- start:317 stop:535 length:219 start_codon:yes stop_codon:yes gene_type:complete
VVKLKELITEKKSEKIQVPGIGVYTWDTLTSKVIKMSKDLEKNSKKGDWNKSSRNAIRAFAEMWNALAEYER